MTITVLLGLTGKLLRRNRRSVGDGSLWEGCWSRRANDAYTSVPDGPYFPFIFLILPAASLVFRIPSLDTPSQAKTAGRDRPLPSAL